MSARQFVPVTLVVSILGAALLCIVAPTAGMLGLGAIICAYLGANLMASVITAGGDDRDVLPLLPVTFAALHFSYGSGFLVGLVKFRHRWRDRAVSTW
jgi:hypothetical protein